MSELPVAAWEQILARAEGEDDPGEWVDVPEWGASFRVRGLSRAEVDHILSSGTSEDEANIYALARAVIEPQCDDDKARQLVRKSSAPLQRLLNAVYDRSGLGATFREGNPGEVLPGGDPGGVGASTEVSLAAESDSSDAES